MSSMKAFKFIRKGYSGCLCFVLNVPTIDKANVDSIPIVKEFPDVFSNDLPGDLLDREIEFTIEVMLGT